MKIIIKTFLILFILAAPALAQVESSYWQTKKSQHFIIYYQQAGDSFVNELADKAENYYNTILDDLGYRRMDFWSWDNRAKIYLFNNSSDYLKDTRGVSWSGAQVTIKTRTIKTFVGQPSFFDSILPHEMTHIIFREFIGLKKDLPLWLDEGIACSQEASSLASRLQASKELIKQNSFLKFDKLGEIYNSTLVVPNIFYAEAASIITFLLNKYDRENFLEFSRKVRDGMHWREALLKAYRFKDLDQMQEAWKDYMLR